MKILKTMLMMGMLLALVVAVGCQQQGAPRGDFGQIKAGQNVQQVEQLLGKADEQTPNELVYNQPDQKVIIPLQNGKVSDQPLYGKPGASRQECSRRKLYD